MIGTQIKGKKICKVDFSFFGKSHFYFRFVYQSSGEEVSYTDWQTGYPTNGNGNNCVYVTSKDSKWKNKAGASKSNYVCEKGKPISVITQSYDSILSLSQLLVPHLMDRMSSMNLASQYSIKYASKIHQKQHLKNLKSRLQRK